MRRRGSTRSDASTARVLAASTVKPVAVAVSAGLSQQVSVTVNGLAQARHDGHVNSSAAQHIALERGAGASMALWLRITRTRQPSACYGHAALNDVTGGGIIGGNGGQELVKLVIVAKLQQVAFAHGLKQLNAGDGGAATAVVGLEAAHIAVGPRLPSTVPTIWPRLLERS